MNDGIYLPFAPERFQKFKDGLERLHAQVNAAGARIIHLTPPTYEEGAGARAAGYAAVLDRYSDWLLEQRANRQWEAIDLHRPLKMFLETGRRKDPEFFLAKDGIHPGELGHWFIAREILRHLGARDLDDVDSAAAMVSGYPHGPEILRLVSQRHALMRDAWLTATRHTRPGVKAGLPLPEAQARAAEIDRQILALLKNR